MSLQAPPQLHNTQAVTFDATLGWVTPTENMVVKQSALDKIAPIVFVGVATWMTAGAFGIAGGAGVTAGAGIGAAGGVVGAMTAGAAFGAIGGFYGGLIGEGRIDPKAMFRGALTGAVTAGVVRAAGLNEMGVTRELNRQGQSVITGIDYTQRALAVTGQATLQGALTAITGGEFKDGFTAGLAQGLGTEIGRGLELKITEMQAGNTPISATEAGALRQFARVAQSAVSLLGNPDDPGHAFAMTFVNGLVGDVQGGLDARSLQGQGPWSDAGYRNGSDIESDAYNPASAYDYRNGSDMASEHAEQLRRNEAWSAQSDAITARRGSEVGVQGNEPNVAQTNAASPANATPAINGAVDHGTSPTQTVVIIGARPPTGVAVDVTLPEGVAPGSAINLAGTATVALTGEAAAAALARLGVAAAQVDAAVAAGARLVLYAGERVAGYFLPGVGLVLGAATAIEIIQSGSASAPGDAFTAFDGSVQRFKPTNDGGLQLQVWTPQEPSSPEESHGGWSTLGRVTPLSDAERAQMLRPLTTPGTPIPPTPPLVNIPTAQDLRVPGREASGAVNASPPPLLVDHQGWQELIVEELAPVV